MLQNREIFGLRFNLYLMSKKKNLKKIGKGTHQNRISNSKTATSEAAEIQNTK